MAQLENIANKLDNLNKLLYENEATQMAQKVRDDAQMAQMLETNRLLSRIAENQEKTNRQTDERLRRLEDRAGDRSGKRY